MADEVQDWQYELQALRDESEQTIRDLRQRMVNYRGSWLKANQMLQDTQQQLQEVIVERDELRAELDQQKPKTPTKPAKTPAGRVSGSDNGRATADG